MGLLGCAQPMEFAQSPSWTPDGLLVYLFVASASAADSVPPVPPLVPCRQQPATAPGPRRSVDDADASAAPHLPQLPGTGSWNAACASPVAGAAVHHLGKETTRNWRM